ISPAMATAASMLSLVLNFQRTSRSSGSVVVATPVWRGLPRKRGQSAADKQETRNKKQETTRGYRIHRMLRCISFLVSCFLFLVFIIVPSHRSAATPPPRPGAD